MSSGNVRITPDIAEVLAKGTGDGNLYRLPGGALDRKLYLACAKVLEALGGKWNRKLRVFLGPDDFHFQVITALAAGQAVDQDKRDAFFRTPPAVATAVVELLGKLPNHSDVLEPSCGDGALLAAFAVEAVRGGHQVHAVELDVFRASKARVLHTGEYDLRIAVYDFLEGAPIDPAERFDAILMNPPWGQGREYDHVEKALSLLALGGRLVAVLPTGVRWRQNRRNSDFRTALALAGNYHFHDLPEHSFRGSGTDVASCILTLDKKKD